jgi:glutamyl-tRNA reductase
MQRIIVAGISHHTAPVAVRETLAISPAEYPAVLARLMAWPGVREGAVLSTCNRSEVYAVATSEDGVELPAFTRGLARSASADELVPHIFLHRGERAVQHLFEVASGVDSLVVGEPQILGQVKQAFASARDLGTTGVVLERLFQRALEVGKRVRSDTAIGEHAVSIPYAACELARKIFGKLSGRPALIIGAGEMGELALRHLLDEGVAPVYVVARSDRRVEEMRDRLRVDLEKRPLDGDTLAAADVVVTASGSREPLVSASLVREAMTRRRQRPLFLIDIAVPRNVEPAASGVYNVFVYDLDDLGKVVAQNRERREREMGAVGSIVSEETDRFLAWYRGRKVVPMLTALRSQFEDVRREEEERALARLDHLSDRDKDLVRKFGATLVHRILHEPSVRLRTAAAGSDSYATLEGAVSYLFGLEAHTNGAGGDRS